LGATDSQRSAIVSSFGGDILSRRSAILISILLATSLVSSAQSIPSVGSPRQLVDLAHKSKRHSSPPPFTHLKPQTLEAPYQPLTTQEHLRWFTANTIDPGNLAGGLVEAALGTAPNRPKAYGSHWGGLGRRFGMGMTGNAAENAIEAGASLTFREDPRFFRMPDQPFRSRVRNVMRLTFAARNGKGSFTPAYARYMAVFGANFLSNSWRVNSEANTHDALLRSAEDIGGNMAANAFEEFWPDVKKRLFHKLLGHPRVPPN
jgi:hypothetical protein